MTETIDPMTTTGLASLGWDEGWTAAFAEAGHASAGHRPARVVAVHRETSIVRDGDGDRTASRLGRVPVRGPGRLGLPDRRRLGRHRRERRHRGRPAAPDGVQADGRRRQPRCCPGSMTSRSWPRTSTSRCSSPASTTTSTCAGSNATSRWPGRARSLPVVVLNKADLADDVDGRVVAVEADRTRRRDRPGLGLDRPRAGRPASSPPPGHDGRDPRIVRRREVHPRQRAARRGPPGDRGRPRLRLARPAHDHAPRAVRTAGRRAPRRHARDPRPGGPRRGGRPRGRLRRGRRDRRDLPVQRLRPRERARLRGPPRHRRRPDRRGASRQLPQARSASRRGWRARRTRGPGPRAGAPGSSSTSPSTST